MKLTIKVQAWPFANIRNHLELVIQTDGNSTDQNSCPQTQSSADGSNNLQWFKLNVDGVSLYPYLFILVCFFFVIVLSCFISV